MEVMWIFVTLAILLSHCDYTLSFAPLIPLAVGSLGGLAGVGYMTLYCRFKECCNDDYIPANFTLLNKLLKQNLYGQHLAHNTILRALRSHVNSEEPKKALAMSFHGSPGTGKNYITDFITKALYKKGAKSNYVQNYRGRLDFRSEGLMKQYQGELQRNITRLLKVCPRSIFIFDEIEKIPAETLDILVPFLDYDPKITDENNNHVDATRAIFIFLSNTGGSLIAKEMIRMWELGKARKDTELRDFEKLLTLSAFNEKGGFYKSDTIESSLIDHYVPFLPLEEEHVRRCIVDAFKKRGVEPDDDAIDKAMKDVTFVPPPHNLYSYAGCKRLDQKVGSIIQADYFTDL